jgi:hypothetical protein
VIEEQMVNKNRSWVDDSALEKRIRDTEREIGKLKKVASTLASTQANIVAGLADIAAAIREQKQGATSEELDKIKAEILKNTQGIIAAKKES